MQLHPREIFTVTHQLNNPAYITDTAYVRAVIRNAKTDATLSTLTLTDKGSGRFTGDYQVPADVSGQGFWISIITTVYSDSGYTTQSQNYGVEVNTYLVQDRFNHNIGGVGGGADIDYKRIKKMIDSAVKKIIKEVDSVEPKVVTVTNEVVKEVRVPEVKVVETQKSQDLSSIIDEIRKVGKKVDDKPVTEIPSRKEIDLIPFFNEIRAVSDNVSDGFKNIKNVEKKVENPTPSRVSNLLGKKDLRVDDRITRLTKL